MKGKNRYWAALLLGVLLASCAPKWPDSLYEKKEVEMSRLSAGEFLYWAMMDGMTADRFPKSLAKTMLGNGREYFVPKCPICREVERALDDYLEKAPDGAKTRLSADVVEALENGSRVEKHNALRDLVNGYVAAEFEKLSLSPRDKARLESDLQNNRKQGMGAKSASFGDFCPSCDGACQMGD